MGPYILSGLVSGSIFAIAALGLVLTYRASGILNFGYGAIAFLTAVLYYQLYSKAHWSAIPAAILTIFVIAPALGVFLWFVLFRFLADTPQIVKLVSTIGLYVAIPSLVFFFFGNSPVFITPGLAGTNPHVYQILGFRINANQLIVLIAAVLVVLFLTFLLHFTEFGLAIRAVVDSRTMSGLFGVNQNLVSIGSWAIGCFLAGLAGVLLAPLIQLDPDNYGVLLASAFTAAVIGRLSSLVGVFAGAMLLGIIEEVSVKYAPQSGWLSYALRPSLPFLLMAVAMTVIYVHRGRVQLQTSAARWYSSKQVMSPLGPAYRRSAGAAVAIILLLLPVLFSSYWTSIFSYGLAFAVIFLSFQMVTGYGGMISLCQISFAGIGAVIMALMLHHGVPTIPAVLLGGLAAVPFGLVVAVPSLRVGDLYLALATLAFGLLLDNAIFPTNVFYHNGQGQLVNRPSIFGVSFQSDKALYYAYFVVFCIGAAFISLFRRSTRGRSLAAMRSSEVASACLGINVVRLKLLTFGLSAFIAGVGGALLAVHDQLADPTIFSTLAGLIWLAVIVVQGLRTTFGALVAGLVFTIFPALLTLHFSTRWQYLFPIAFGLAAIQLAKQPNGVLEMQKLQIFSLVTRIRGRGSPPALPDSIPGVEAAPGETAVPAVSSATGGVSLGSRPSEE